MKNLKLFVFLSVAAFSLAVLRMIQVVFLTDYKTGFFYDNLDTLGILISVLMVVIIGISALMAFLADKRGVSPLIKPSKILGVASVMAGASHLAEIFSSNFMLSSAVPLVMLVLRYLGILAVGIIFIYFGIMHLQNKTPSPKLNIALVVGWILRLTTTFLSFMGMSNISENVYDIIMLVATLLFFNVYTKCQLELSNKNTLIQIYLWGVIAVLSSALAVTPTVSAIFVKSEMLLRNPIDNPITGFCTALYITVYLILLNIKQKESKEP